MKSITFKSFKLQALILGAAGLAVLGTPAFALDFEYTFENTSGNVGLPTDVVTGRILGLSDNSFNFGPTTVTVDSVSPAIDPSFTPDSWTSFGVLPVFGGVLSSVSFSAIDGAYAINIDSGNSPFFALADFSKYYLGGGESLTIRPLTESVPDGGSTAMLLGLASAGFGLLRRKLA